MNTNLVRDLKALGIWDDVKERLLVEQGDLTNIEQIPQHLKDVYKTCFQVFAFIEVAARAQKWVDQAISRNMYLESRSIDDMKRSIWRGWLRGLKTTYYLHMKPRHQAEQSTTKVNKGKHWPLAAPARLGLASQRNKAYRRGYERIYYHQ